MNGEPMAFMVSRINKKVSLMNRQQIDVALKRLDRNIEFNGMNMWDVIEICALQARVAEIDRIEECSPE